MSFQWIKVGQIWEFKSDKRECQVDEIQIHISDDGKNLYAWVSGLEEEGETFEMTAQDFIKHASPRLH